MLKSNTAITLTQKGDNSIDYGLFNNSWVGTLPEDYLHILNCIVEYTVKSTFKCYDVNDKVHFAAKRLTADSYAGILNNYYMRPEYKRPYYYIENYNSSSITETPYDTSDFTIPSSPSGNNSQYSDSYENAQSRLANVSPIKIEIRCGKDSSIFHPDKVYIDYIKAPQKIRLTQSQIDTEADTSQVLEFPDYVCFEIVNEFVKLLLENASDPRLQTNFAVNQTIANPLQQAQDAQAQAAARKS